MEIFDGEEAAAIALAGCDYDEAPRIGILGDSGCGKTNAMIHVIKRYREKMKNAVVLIVDDKGRAPQFKGCQEFRYPSETNIDRSGPQIVSYRGDPYDLKKEVNPEDVARIQWSLSRSGRPSLGVYDELDKACDHAQWKEGDASVIRWLFKKGRDVQTGLIWGTQETQEVPASAFNQSSNILAFRMVGAPLRLLKERGYCEGGVEKVIPALPGDELPRAKRGFFVLLRRGRPWDGKVYRFGGGSMVGKAE